MVDRPAWLKNECGTCGYPYLRPEGHANWCWTANGERYPFGRQAVGPRQQVNVDDAVQRYEAGESTASIGESYGVSDWVVREVLRGEGVLRSRAAVTEEQIAAVPAVAGNVVRLWDAGHGTSSIALSTGLAADTVRSILLASGRRK